jgi:hypothetical protein
MRCVRYPIPEKIENTDTHRCGELRVDADKVREKGEAALNILALDLFKAKRAHRKQVRYLREKYKNLKATIAVNALKKRRDKIAYNNK